MRTRFKEQAKAARRKVLEMVHRAGTSHIASNFSVIDIATVLYDVAGKNDLIIWSKGWVAATIYYFLSLKGEIPAEDLEKFPNEPYFGLAEPAVNGVHVAGGSMGHGLPVAVGMALGKKLAGEPGRVFCIMSDGEMNEGTTWESAAVAAHHKLDNLVVLIDANGWQAMGKTKDVLNFDPIPKHWRGFGWFAVSCNGHDHKIINHHLSRAPEAPFVIVCKTIKGKGVSFMEDHLLYHYKHVSDEAYKNALEQLV